MTPQAKAAMKLRAQSAFQRFRNMRPVQAMAGAQVFKNVRPGQLVRDARPGYFSNLDRQQELNTPMWQKVSSAFWRAGSATVEGYWKMLSKDVRNPAARLAAVATYSALGFVPFMPDVTARMLAKNIDPTMIPPGEETPLSRELALRVVAPQLAQMRPEPPAPKQAAAVRLAALTKIAAESAPAAWLRQRPAEMRTAWRNSRLRNLTNRLAQLRHAGSVTRLAKPRPA